MCCGPFDYDYPTFSGKHLRADRSHGRVGSVLSDPFRTLTGPVADSNLTPPPEPNDPEEDADTLDLDDLDDLDDLETDSDVEAKMKELEKELEGIEPLRDSEAIDNPGEDVSGDGNSTASNRWRPRPLRSRIR